MAVLAAREQLLTRASDFWQRDSNAFLQGTVVYLLAYLLLALIMFVSPGFFSTDDYYHARISEVMIRQGRLALDFPWLPMTILSPDKYVDHHLLYHMALAPAVALFGMTGAKLMTTAIAAGIFAAAWALFRKIRVNYPLLWTLGLFGVSATFTIRMLMIRTQGFSFLLLTLALIALFQKRYRWLVPLGFLYVWLYNGFVLMLAFAGLYAVAVFLVEKRIAWEPVVYCALGLLLGVVVNPYFPKNIEFVLDHLGAKVDLEGSIPLGQEWNAFSTRTWLAELMGTILAMVFGFIRPYFGRQRDVIETTLMFCAVVTGFMSFQSMRFLEYFPGLAVMFVAASWGRDPVLRIAWPWFQQYKRYIVPGVLTLVVAYFSGTMWLDTYNLGKSARPPEEYAGSAAWLERNTPPGTMVFTTGFNDFSRLFFFNQRNTWVIGLDPTYLSYIDRRLWDYYDAIRIGRVERPSEIIAREFGLQYALSSRGRHPAFNRRAHNDPGMEMVFRDNYTIVWRVRDEVFERLNTSPRPPYPLGINGT